jgi:hypothetical protein
VALEHQEHGAVDADLLGVRGREPVEGVLGVRAEGGKAAGEVRFSVLEAAQVGGEAGQVATGGAVVALGLVLQRAGLALRQPGAEEFLWLRRVHGMRSETPVSSEVWIRVSGGGSATSPDPKC